jgi:ketosteroid isomerase-like protein
LADYEVEEESVRQLILDMGDAFNRKDAGAFIKGFHEDVLVLYPNLPLMKGLESLKQFIEEAVKDNISVKYDKIIVIISESGDHGYGIGVFSGYNKTSSGQVGFTSRFHVTVWKISGAWRVVAISYNR